MGLFCSAAFKNENAEGANLGWAREPGDAGGDGRIGSSGAEACPPAAGTEGAARSAAWCDASARSGRLFTGLGIPES